MKIIKIDNIVFVSYPIIVTNTEKIDVQLCHTSIVYDLCGNKLKPYTSYFLSVFLVIKAAENSCVGDKERYII